MISGDGRDGSATIRQDADVFRVRLKAGGEAVHVLRPGRGLWLQVMRGCMTLNGVLLQPGDGASAEQGGSYVFAAEGDAEALLFHLE